MRDINGRTRSERGAVAVEFALILPILLMVVFGTIEFGRVYSQFQVFNGAAREGARCAAVKATTYSDCDVQTRINDAARPYTPDEDADVLVGSGGTVCTASTVGQPVTVSWEQSFQLNVPFWDNAAFTRTIEATFRCE